MALKTLSYNRIQILPPSSSCTLLFHIPTNAVQFTYEIFLLLVPFHSCCYHTGPVSCYLIPKTSWYHQHPKAGKVNPKSARSPDTDSPKPEKTKVTSFPTIIWADAITDCLPVVSTRLCSARIFFFPPLLSFSLPPSLSCPFNQYLLTVCYVIDSNAGDTMDKTLVGYR